MCKKKTHLRLYSAELLWRGLTVVWLIVMVMSLLLSFCLSQSPEPRPAGRSGGRTPERCLWSGRELHPRRSTVCSTPTDDVYAPSAGREWDTVQTHERGNATAATEMKVEWLCGIASWFTTALLSLTQEKWFIAFYHKWLNSQSCLLGCQKIARFEQFEWKGVEFVFFSVLTASDF